MNRLALLLLIVALCFSCTKNHPPVISELKCNPETGDAGSLFTLTATAADEDEDNLIYTWSAEEGSFPNVTNTREIRWQSPFSGVAKTYTLSVTVSDGKNSVSQNIRILLAATELGSLEGHTYYTNFTIPVPEATVTAGDYKTTTNEAGYFRIDSLPAGKCTLSVTEQDFSNSTMTIEIPANGVRVVKTEITSVNHTTKLSGIITDDTDNPLEYARIVVLNPDGSESHLNSTTNTAGYYSLLYIPHGQRTLVVNRVAKDSFAYVELSEKIDFQEIETQLNLRLEKTLICGEFTDPRDNHVYHYRLIGNLTWMTENLAYLPRVSPPNKGSEEESFFYVYDYSGNNTEEAMATDNYRTYGVLYNWPAAMSTCPKGWHLPAKTEWNELINPYTSQMAGLHLKSQSGWYNHGDGDNKSKFSALPAGLVYLTDSTFSGITRRTSFWTSFLVSPTANSLSWDENVVFTYWSHANNAYSVRCVKDY